MAFDENGPTRGQIAGGVAIVLFLLILFSAFIFWMVNVSSVNVEQGQEAVLVQKPRFFGEKGVNQTPVKTGHQYVWSTTTAIMVNMQPQRAIVGLDDVMSSDGVPLDFESSMNVQITDSVDLISRFGPDWYKQNVEQQFMALVRAAVKKHGLNETAINTQAADVIDKEVTDNMLEYFKQLNLPVRLIGITVGKANPPDSIKTQRIQTAAEQQRIQTEQQRKLAEDERENSERARAKADNAYRESMQLSPDQFLQLETIKMQEKACEKGNCTFLVGSSAMPTYNVRK